jgi:glycosyltransferase involved in cell wall biosynthesis
MDLVFISSNDWVAWGGSEVLWSEGARYVKQHYPKMQIAACVKKWDPVPSHIEALSANGIEIHEKDEPALSMYKRGINQVLPSSRKFGVTPFYKFVIDNKTKLTVFSLGDHNGSLDIIADFRKRRLRYVLVVQLVKEANIFPDELSSIIKDNYVGAEKVFFVSRQNLELMQLQLACDLLNAEVISNPFPQQSKNDTITYPLAHDSFSLAFVASLSANHKGHDLLFQVLSQEKWRTRQLTLNLYGKGPHEKYLQNLKRYFKLERINFRGFSNSIEDVWRHNHAAILCSRMEGQSLALLEAMSYNRMAIVTDVGDACELIEDGVNGFIAEATTVKHIDQALEHAWNSRQKWEEMGLKAGDTLRSLRIEDPIEVFARKVISLLN